MASVLICAFVGLLGALDWPQSAPTGPSSFAAAAPDPARVVVGEVGARIARYAEQAGAFGFTGTVLAARGGKVLAATGVGLANQEREVPNDARTLFELASVTKQFTAAAVLRLVQQGKLQLDDPIHEHLPGVPEDCRGITIRHLLQHTSGMPGTNSRGWGDDLATVLPLFLAGGPRHPPGTHHEYWNQGYSLVTAIVEKAAGCSYVEFCKQQLFGPGGLTTACFTGDAAPAGVPVSIGRSWRGASRSALDHPYGSYGYQYRGMGGAVASVWDLWHWDRALRGEAVLGAQAKAELFRPGLEDHALGWFVRRLEGRTVQMHGGSVRGFLCEIRRYPAEDAFLAVLCNRDDGPMGEVANGVAKILFGGTQDLPVPLPAAAGADLVGSWQSELGKLDIVRQGEILALTLRWKQMGAVTRGCVVGKGLDSAQLFDWHSTAPFEVERDQGGALVAFRMDGVRFTRS